MPPPKTILTVTFDLKVYQVLKGNLTFFITVSVQLLHEICGYPIPWG